MAIFLAQKCRRDWEPATTARQRSADVVEADVLDVTRWTVTGEPETCRSAPAAATSQRVNEERRRSGAAEHLGEVAPNLIDTRPRSSRDGSPLANMWLRISPTKPGQLYGGGVDGLVLKAVEGGCVIHRFIISGSTDIPRSVSGD